MSIRVGRAVLAGIGGTIAMTAFGVWVVPLAGLSPMNPANMLAGAMGGSMFMGWMGHFSIGIVLALIYAALEPGIPGSPPVGGALYGVAPWLLAQVVVIPMMGMPLFSGSVPMAGASLLGHLIYGGVVGMIYGRALREEAPVVATA